MNNSMDFQELWNVLAIWQKHKGSLKIKIHTYFIQNNSAASWKWEFYQWWTTQHIFIPYYFVGTLTTLIRFIFLIICKITKHKLKFFFFFPVRGWNPITVVQEAKIPLPSESIKTSPRSSVTCLLLTSKQIKAYSCSTPTKPEPPSPEQISISSQSISMPPIYSQSLFVVTILQLQFPAFLPRSLSAVFIEYTETLLTQF